jgi:hypothetical protein
MSNYSAYNMTVLSDLQTREVRANAPSSTGFFEQIPTAEVFARFFETKNSQYNQELRRFVDESVGRSGKKINHVKNWTVGAGFLVPEGYELTEKLDDDSKGYTLTISRPGSLYKARI